MRRMVVMLGIVVLGMAGCDNDDLPPTKTVLVTSTSEPGTALTLTTSPPTQIVMVVTATPEPGVILVPVTVTPIPEEGASPTTTTAPAQVVVVTATLEPGVLLVPATVTPTPDGDDSETNAPPPSETATDEPTATGPPTATPFPTATARPSLTPTPEIFPTDTVAQVQMAEQVFEHGRMFWIRHRRQIWVMQAAPDDPEGGDWYCYYDTFEDGEMELDSSLMPPEGLYQPRRGFGKLWRNVPMVQEGLGWAITPEFELTSTYIYRAGGYVEDVEYFPGPGEHRLTTLYNESISFFEGDIRGDCVGGTWHFTVTR
jgi:hypothetical protein